MFFLEEYLRMAMIMGMAICKWGSDGPTHAGHFVFFIIFFNGKHMQSRHFTSRFRIPE